MLTLPVKIAFAFKIELKPASWNDKNLLQLPARFPVVMAKRRLPPTLEATRHVIVESDIQLLASQMLPPSRKDAEPTASPNDAPRTVRLAQPVTARLWRAKALTLATSKLADWDKDPLTNPDVADTKRLAPFPREILIGKEVSEIQVLRSHTLAPTRTEAHTKADAKPAPMTLTLDDPVAFAFIITALLRTSSANENTSDIVDVAQPADTAASRVPTDPVLHLLLTFVSDIQAELSLTVLPSSTAGERK